MRLVRGNPLPECLHAQAALPGHLGPRPVAYLDLTDRFRLVLGRVLPTFLRRHGGHMSTMASKKRRQYTSEYQAEAVRQVKIGDRPRAKVARERGLSMQTLWKWVPPDKPHSATKEEAGELTRPEREELK